MNEKVRRLLLIFQNPSDPRKNHERIFSCIFRGSFLLMARVATVSAGIIDQSSVESRLFAALQS